MVCFPFGTAGAGFGSGGGVARVRKNGPPLWSTNLSLRFPVFLVVKTNSSIRVQTPSEKVLNP